MIFIIGLTYNTRGSTAYLYGTEFLPSSYHLLFGQATFIGAGVSAAASGLFFYLFKSQTIYFIILILMISLSLFWTVVFAPESPIFLYECERFHELSHALAAIQKVNGNFDQNIVESVILKLKEQKLKDKIKTQ